MRLKLYQGRGVVWHPARQTYRQFRKRRSCQRRLLQRFKMMDLAPVAYMYSPRSFPTFRSLSHFLVQICSLFWTGITPTTSMISAQPVGPVRDGFHQMNCQIFTSKTCPRRALLRRKPSQSNLLRPRKTIHYTSTYEFLEPWMKRTVILCHGLQPSPTISLYRVLVLQRARTLLLAISDCPASALAVPLYCRIS